MKAAIVALSCIFLLTSCSEDDITGTVKKSHDIDAHIADYKQKTISIPEQRTEGGSVTIYTQNSKLILVTDTSYSLTGAGSARYYFDDGDLIAVTQNDYVYNQPVSKTKEQAAITGDSTWYDATRTKLKTNRYYFYHNRMVKWIANNSTDVDNNDKRYDLQQAILLKDVEKIRKMAR